MPEDDGGVGGEGVESFQCGDGGEVGAGAGNDEAGGYGGIEIP